MNPVSAKSEFVSADQLNKIRTFLESPVSFELMTQGVLLMSCNDQMNLDDLKGLKVCPICDVEIIGHIANKKLRLLANLVKNAEVNNSSVSFGKIKSILSTSSGKLLTESVILYPCLDQLNEEEVKVSEFCPNPHCKKSVEKTYVDIKIREIASLFQEWQMVQPPAFEEEVDEKEDDLISPPKYEEPEYNPQEISEVKVNKKQEIVFPGIPATFVYVSRKSSNSCQRIYKSETPGSLFTSIEIFCTPIQSQIVRLELFFLEEEKQKAVSFFKELGFSRDSYEYFDENGRTGIKAPLLYQDRLLALIGIYNTLPPDLNEKSKKYQEKYHIINGKLMFA